MFEDENNPAPEGEELSTPAEEADTETEEVEVPADDVTEDIPEPDEPDEADEYEEVEWEDGKKYTVPKALKDGVMRQADYTRKTQEVAEQRRQFETQRAEFNDTVKLHTTQIEKIAEIRALDQQLAQYGQVDWDGLRENDQQSYLYHDRQHRMLMQKKQEATAELQRTASEVQQRQRAEHAKAVQENQRIVAERIPDWSPEKARELGQYALSIGFSERDVNSVYKADHIEVLHKAMMYDKLQKQRPAKPKPEPAKPVTRIRPKAAKASKDPAKMNMDEYAAWRKQGGG